MSDLTKPKSGDDYTYEEELQSLLEGALEAIERDRLQHYFTEDWLARAEALVHPLDSDETGPTDEERATTWPLVPSVNDEVN